MALSYTRASFAVARYATRAEMGAAAARDVSGAIRALLDTTQTVSMVFAAAPSQQEFLDALCADASIDFGRIVAFHMDEYVGLPDGAPQRFGTFLRDRLFDRVPFGQVHFIDGNAADASAECARYAGLLRAQPPDIICLGIGENGHIAFNDPHVARLDDPHLCKVVTLDDVCRMQQVHDGCFAALAEVPQQAITLTVPALLRAAHHFCIVPAATKARAVRAAIVGPVDMACPASALRLCADARVYLDADSGALLSEGVFA